MKEFIGVLVIVIIIGGFAAAPFVWMAEKEQARREHATRVASQTVVRVCKPPAFRRPSEFIVRDAEGLWLVREGFVKGDRRKIDGADLDDICRPAGQSIIGRLW